MKRPQRSVDSSVKGGSPFGAPSTDLEFVKSGCSLLDLVVGGGWPLGRVTNIVGDKSTGKTLLAIEAAANFARDYPKGKIWYAEAESAFDKGYAKALGMPIERVKFVSPDTVEDFQENLNRQTTYLQDRDVPGLYILDSLDSLSDRKEMQRDVDTPTYGQDKAKQLSQLFRKITRRVEKSQLSLIIISQVRDKIGISFGRKTSRAGGKALDFYASQVIYLSHIKTLVKTRKKMKRAVGVRIRAKCDKNKVSLPFRECDFQINFGFGTNSAAAGLAWLIEAGRQDLLGLTKSSSKSLLSDLEGLDQEAYKEWEGKINRKLKRAWYEVEQTFLPKWSKYGRP